MDSGITARRTHSTQAEALPPLHFQPRDGAILRAIYAYDGVLAKRQIKRLFWPEATWRAMELRLARLRQHGYLAWPDREQWRSQPIPEPVCWLGWRGALWVAGQEGCEVDLSEIPNETQLRQLERQLRAQGIHWLRQPRWSQLQHDLAVVDVRLAVEQSVRELPALALETWIAESAFRREANVVEYTVLTGEGGVKRGKRGVCPDGYFLVELDGATRDVPSFGYEKAGPGWAYLKSPQYRARFGDTSGRWLVITTSQVRLRHLMHETWQAIGEGAGVFLFTTLEQVLAQNVFISPIWWQVGRGAPGALLAG